MRTIPLKPHGFVKVDDDDYEWLQHLSWRLNVRTGYCFRNAAPKFVYIHRLIMEPCDPFQVDHINGDKLDNRKRNLRLVSPAENCRNRDFSSVVKRYSKFYGVSFIAKDKAWTARIATKQGKKLYLGRYDTELEAAVAYDIDSEKHWGRFARLNFPKGRPPIIPQRRKWSIMRTAEVLRVGDTKIIVRNPDPLVRSQLIDRIRHALL